ncbi:MAG: glycosyl transferase family protein [uncultured bacterium]|nr:MAG: glycosyl transferase family protein [uncultured bacterium]
MISIIIPVYNHEEALHRSLVSLENQTFQDIEVIVVDDGSRKKLEIGDWKFSFKLVHQENSGAPAARNKGFELSKGEYVIFWDADLIAEPEMLEKMVATLERNKNASFVYSNFVFGRKKMKGLQWSNVTIKQCNYVHSTSLIRRTDAILWDESLKKFQDWDYFLTLAEKGNIGIWLNEYLFRVELGGTMSAWLPRFAYHAPFKWFPGIAQKVQKYEVAKKIIQEKHHLSFD